MKRFVLLVGSLLCLAAPSVHAAKAKAKPAVNKTPSNDVVRLQIFLDEQNFSPGRIDGIYGGFTAKSWQRYQESQGITPPVDTFDAKTFTSVDPIFTTYTATADDLGAIGDVPKSLALQAKNKVLPYTNMAELLGERYHVSVDYLRKLNAGKNLDKLKEGDSVTVPNVVPPFNLAQVLALRQYTADRAKAAKAAKELAQKTTDAGNADPAATPAATPEATPLPTVVPSASPPPAADVPALAAAAENDNRPALRATPANSSRLVFHVNTSTNYLEVRDPAEKLVACFPITPGSKSIPTPKGEWKVVAKTLMPQFRWDKSVLMTGKRSSNFYELPSGPNNPVGITWIALSKPGIGMHGTSDPDSIGRSASHGCIRLANWDAFKVFGMVAPGTKVVIE